MVATILLLLSQLLQHIKLLSPRQNDFFCREIKGDVFAEGISVVVVLQGLSLLHSLRTRPPHSSEFFSDAAPS